MSGLFSARYEFEGAKKQQLNLTSFGVFAEET
jgi:hypothetical protein